VEARFKNGVLTIALPKTEQTQSATMRISINGIEDDPAAPAA
jgi:HSP20 family molecular chaperone IbpA